MSINFTGHLTGLWTGIEILSKEMGVENLEGQYSIEIVCRPGDLEIVLEGFNGKICFEHKAHFFRAFGLLVEGISKQVDLRILEEPQFSMNGAMFDVSRNAVLKVDAVKKLLRKMSLMGLNMIMLYMEDVYTIEGEPYFGYMRGRYSYEELKECDDYADALGVEMIPCIQALAHLWQFLKWSEASKYRDTSQTLLVGSENTYEFIDKMIATASAPFRSKRIHLGMDEAEDLGLGKYLQINGYKKHVEIMGYHLKKVLEITSAQGLEPMIWSDMFIKMVTQDNNYYDINAQITDEVRDCVPAGIDLVYWDYYHHNQDFYESFIDKHAAFNNKTIFAGGVWTWVGAIVNYGKTIDATNKALSACKSKGIKEVFATMWMDNGAECNFFSALLGLQLYAEHGFSKTLDESKLRDRVKFCTGIDYDAYLDISKVDEIPGVSKGNFDNANPSKYLIYQDVLIGLFDKHIEGLELRTHYSELESVLAAHDIEYGKIENIFSVPAKMCAVLKDKSQLGLHIRKLYLAGDKAELGKIAMRLPLFSQRVNDLREAHRQVWFESFKPYGWEVIDIRYGGVIARLDSVMKRLNDYVNGDIERIEELEAERLYINSMDIPENERAICLNNYCGIVTGAGM